MWCVAELNEAYIARMEDVLKVYEMPLSERTPVVCVDEKPVVLHADVRQARPIRPGHIMRRDCESAEFADYLVEIVASYPEADTIHLVMDNLSTHKRKALVDRFGEKIGGLLWERFTVHYTPKHGSWLNQAEIEISLFSRQCLGQRRIPTLSDLRREAKAWNSKMNRNRVIIDWQFTRSKARMKFGYNRNNFKLSET
jgi:transposase